LKVLIWIDEFLEINILREGLRHLLKLFFAFSAKKATADSPTPKCFTENRLKTLKVF
jgi:hypothetical protein